MSDRFYSLGDETEQVEFKKSTGELKEAVISIAAILNKHGSGDLYFGVKNNGEVIGQEITDKTIREVSQAIGSHLRPVIYPEIKKETYDGRDVVHVRFEGHMPPYTAYNIPRIRVADEDLVMAQDIYDDMIRGRDDFRKAWELLYAVVLNPAHPKNPAAYKKRREDFLYMVNESFSEEQARSYLKETLPQLDYWKKYEQLSDGGQFEAFKKQLIEEINALHIDGMPKVEKLNALVGKFVNLEYRLPSGENVKFLDDQTTYLGNQLESEKGDGRCFGVLANKDFILICTYGEEGIDPELVLYKKR